MLKRMSTPEPPVVTIHLIDYDRDRWIWVPHIWPHEGFAGPEPWADAYSRAVDQRTGFFGMRFVSRRRLRRDLVQMALSRDGEGTEWTVAHVPDQSTVPRIARISAHAREHGYYTSLEQFLQLDDPTLHETPDVEPFTSPHLGDGITTLARQKQPDGSLAAVRGYGWQIEGTWVTLSVADTDLRHLESIRPDIDALARSLAFEVDTGSGPAYSRAQQS